jgi:mRNA interferase MazF
MRRGDIRWFTFEPPDKRRPVLILTRDSAIGILSTVTVAPITSTMRGIPTEVFLDRADGMPFDCAVNLDHIQTIPKSKVGALLSTLSNQRMGEVQSAVNFSLGFDSEPLN